jgi:energy-converting hydrogenase Eha subunit G
VWVAGEIRLRSRARFAADRRPLLSILVTSGDAGIDHRGSRRLSRSESVCWYLLAAVSYIGVGMFHKWLLTWFLGPAWLVAVIVAGPVLLDRFRRR